MTFVTSSLPRCLALLCLLLAVAAGDDGVNAARPGEQALSYADMYYHVEVSNKMQASHPHHSLPRWWEFQRWDASMRAQLLRGQSSRARSGRALDEPFLIDFFGVKGGLGIGTTPFFTKTTFTMTPHDVCPTKPTVGCMPAAFNGGRVSEADCRASPDLQATPDDHSTPGTESIAKVPPEFAPRYALFPKRNVGVPWVTLSFFDQTKQIDPKAFWTDASKQCVGFDVRATIEKALRVGLFAGQVELCRNGTVTLRYESVPSIPEEGRAAALRRCLALAASNATDPAFVLEPFVGLSANERMAISLPPPRWVTTAGPNGTTTRRLTVTAYRITPRHLLPNEGFEPGRGQPRTTLLNCSSRSLHACADAPDCVWCWGARPTDQALRAHAPSIPKARCMHTSEREMFCPAHQSGPDACSVAGQLKRAGVRFVQESTVVATSCDLKAENATSSATSLRGFGKCRLFHSGTVHCGMNQFGLDAAYAHWVNGVDSIYPTTAQTKLSETTTAFDWAGQFGRIRATVNPTGAISSTFCNNTAASGFPAAFIAYGQMTGVGLFMSGTVQWVRNPELHVLPGITITFTPVEDWAPQALCPADNVTLPPCPVGFDGASCQFCAPRYRWNSVTCVGWQEPDISPGSTPTMGNEPKHEGTSSVVLFACVGLLVLVTGGALMAAVVYGCRWTAQQRKQKAHNQDGQQAPQLHRASQTAQRVHSLKDKWVVKMNKHGLPDDETPSTFSTYRDAFAPLLLAPLRTPPALEAPEVDSFDDV